MRYFLLFFVLVRGIICWGQSIDICVKNEEGKPIENVYVFKLPERVFLNCTDEKGRSSIEISNYAEEDRLEFTSIGYIGEKQTVGDLRRLKGSLVLKKKCVLLEEVVVERGKFSFNAIMEKATRQMMFSRNRQSSWKIRYCGEGNFNRLLTCKGIPIHIWKSKGFFVTTGNVMREVNGWDWDMAYGFYFLPEYVARSFDFRNDGQDTLKRKYISFEGSRGDKLNYDVTEPPKIYGTMRALYLFGPLFSKKEHFNYKLLEEKDSIYVISFVTNREYYFRKNKVLMEGTLELDKETLRLRKIDIEHFADERFQFKMNKTFMHPYEKHIRAEFAYSQDGECYIQDCTLEVKWLYERDREKRIGNNEGCLRPYPVRDQLVEKEYWHCGEYFPFYRSLYPVECTDKVFLIRLRRMHFYPEGDYDKKEFEEMPIGEEFVKAERAIGKYRDINEQYASHIHNVYVVWERRYPSKEDIFFTMELKNRFIKELKRYITTERYEN